MSEQIEDGGPAFPVRSAAEWKGHGMTLRDYFAAKALQGLIGNSGIFDRAPSVCAPAMVFEAYVAADAMLAHRKVKP